MQKDKLQLKNFKLLEQIDFKHLTIILIPSLTCVSKLSLNKRSPTHEGFNRKEGKEKNKKFA